MIKKVKYKILKKGRKWYTGKDLNSGYENKILITDDFEFEIGQEYEFFAELDIQRSRFGTNVFVYPVLEEKAKNIEKEKKVEKLWNEYNRFWGYCKENNYYYINGFNKLDEILKKLEKLEINIQEEKKEVEKLKTIKKSEEYENKFYRELSYASDTQDYYPKNNFANAKSNLKKLKKLNNDIDVKKMEKEYEELLQKKKKEEEIRSWDKICDKALKSLEKGLIIDISKFKNCPNFVKAKVDKIKTLYEEIFPQTDEFKNNYSKFLNESFDVIGLEDYTNNIFLINTRSLLRREKEIFKDVHKNEIDKITNLSVNNKMYSLTIRLKRDVYIHLLREGIIEIVEFLGFQDTVAFKPELVIKQLYKDKVFSIITKENATEPLTDKEIDKEKIKLYLDTENLENRYWDYKKEHCYNQDYYLVRVEKRGPRGKYFAYYIVGYDKDIRKGFNHRIKWMKEGYYENMSIKEILDDIFYFKEGYKRIQGDVVAKEVKVNVTNYLEKAKKKKYTLKVKTEDNEEIKLKETSTNIYHKYIKNKDETLTKIDSENSQEYTSEEKLQEIINSGIEKVQFRKDFIAEGKNIIKIYLDMFIALDWIRFVKTRTGKEKVFDLADDEILIIAEDKKDDEAFKKLAYKYYYKIVKGDLIIDIKEKEFKDKEYTKMKLIEDFDIKPNFFTKRRIRHKEYIGNHKIEGEIVGNAGRQIFIVKGSFSLTHPQHTKQENIGNDDCFYIIRAAKRHKSRSDLVLD